MSGAGRPLGLATDLYEIRMVESYVRRGMLAPATFSLFVRPSMARPWLLAAGVQRALAVLEDFRFGPEELDYLAGQDVHEEALSYLAELEPEGEVWAVADGTVVLADEPVLEITAPLPFAQLLETALMNAVQLDTLVATKAARCVLAARGRPVVDFGFRRAHGLEAGVRAARAAWIGGCAGTSNVEAGRRHGLPIAGTMAHSFVQAFDDEATAFAAFAADHPGAILLVDTYDTAEGVENAIRVVKEMAAEDGSIRGVRIDSDPLDELAREARRRLDQAGLTEVQIFASGGLDEFAIDELLTARVPVDGFGVGSALVTSSDKPALDIAYKLVDYDGRGRAKYSREKATLPGPKQVLRESTPDTDVLERREAAGEGGLLAPAWRDGRRLRNRGPAEIRERAAEQLDLLPAGWRHPPYPDSPPRPRIGPALTAYAEEVRSRELDS